ncbi:MAG: LacI family DNA-binding transcriptional regulator [Burkholderiales bacterium]|nr:LacI family DNA-binding transcriptional regulator [Opitutaceae bacterium]
MNPQPVTSIINMRDLALFAKCSVNTVSLALRGSHRISMETRDRIQKLADTHGYRPNPMVTALISSRRKSMAPQTIAFLTKFPQPFLGAPDQPVFFAKLLAGMTDKAEALGFRLEEFAAATPDAPEGADLTRLLLARGIRGVLLFPSGDLSVSFPRLDWSQFAVVAAGFQAGQWPVHRTTTDQGRGIEQCVENLSARGYRRIGLALTRALDPRWSYTASGRFFAWQALQPQPQRIPLIPTDREPATDEEFTTWVLQHRPDAVILHLDSMIDLLASIKKRHRLDVLPVLIGPTTRNDVAGVVPCPEELGRTSISVLARELYMNHYGIPKTPEVTMVGGKWRDGARLRPLPASEEFAMDVLRL